MANRTKQWIAQNMRELMAQKSVEKIRIKEICEAADIDRSTFYYHFQDKYDLLAWMFYNTAFQTDIRSVESAAEAIARVKKEYNFFRTAYEDSSQYALWSYILEYFVDRYVQEAEQALGPDAIDEQLRYSIRMFTYGGVGMSREWLVSGGKMPPERVAELMFQSMPENMRVIFLPEG
ncbi:MAG: TetR/AcrR family transcriptional regulator C-terminal domain-containing protein [Clostridia bacterium]|nr:TetR/AcrR family transcriptional regulator C-terminal domain-containing protein [Clostridia bacterium]MBQ6525515.1 TetR/AcrR family transcriptional regulator C-terminal domain-containing protein [Clostridia bacterium]